MMSRMFRVEGPIAEIKSMPSSAEINGRTTKSKFLAYRSSLRVDTRVLLVYLNTQAVELYRCLKGSGIIYCRRKHVQGSHKRQ